jgi:CxC2 like cysteine cluster associated with KDZ transposases
MEEATLSKLGLIIYFGHEGSACPMATTTHSLSVLNIDGFHAFSVAFCACEASPPQHLQLFDNKLFAASINSPKTVFTFELLRHFRIYHLESKGSAFSYIHSLYRLTNDEGSPGIPVRTPSPCDTA